MSSRAEYGLTGASWAAPVCGGVVCADEASCEDEDPATMGSILGERKGHVQAENDSAGKKTDEADREDEFEPPEGPPVCLDGDECGA